MDKKKQEDGAKKSDKINFSIEDFEKFILQCKFPKGIDGSYNLKAGWLHKKYQKIRDLNNVLAASRWVLEKREEQEIVEISEIASAYIKTYMQERLELELDDISSSDSQILGWYLAGAEGSKVGEYYKSEYYAAHALMKVAEFVTKTTELESCNSIRKEVANNESKLPEGILLSNLLIDAEVALRFLVTESAGQVFTKMRSVMQDIEQVYSYNTEKARTEISIAAANKRHQSTSEIRKVIKKEFSTEIVACNPTKKADFKNLAKEIFWNELSCEQRESFLAYRKLKKNVLVEYNKDQNKSDTTYKDLSDSTVRHLSDKNFSPVKIISKWLRDHRECLLANN